MNCAEITQSTELISDHLITHTYMRSANTCIAHNDVLTRKNRINEKLIANFAAAP